MKTVVQPLIAALLISTATYASTATALPNPLVSPTATTNSYKVAVYPVSTANAKLKVMVERAPGKSMLVHLKDTDGAVLATKYIDAKEGNFQFLFDLKDLEDGTYRVEVVCGADRTVHPVTITTQVTTAATRIFTLQ